MSQALTAPVSGAAQAAATRTARTSAGGSGPPGAGSETPAFSSVLDHHVARTAHAEGQHKTTGESGGRRSSHGHGAGNGRHSHKSASAGTTTGGQTTTAGDHAHPPVRAAPTVRRRSRRRPTRPHRRPHGLSALAALSPASGPSDAVQPTAGDTAQASNFIPATVKPAPAPVAPATPDVNATAADQLQRVGLPGDRGPHGCRAASRRIRRGRGCSSSAADRPARPAPQATAADHRRQHAGTRRRSRTTPTPDPAAADRPSGRDPTGHQRPTPADAPARRSDCPARQASRPPSTLKPAPAAARATAQGDCARRDVRHRAAAGPDAVRRTPATTARAASRSNPARQPLHASQPTHRHSPSRRRRPRLRTRPRRHPAWRLGPPRRPHRRRRPPPPRPRPPALRVGLSETVETVTDHDRARRAAGLLPGQDPARARDARPRSRSTCRRHQTASSPGSSPTTRPRPRRCSREATIFDARCRTPACTCCGWTSRRAATSAARPVTAAHTSQSGPDRQRHRRSGQR